MRGREGNPLWKPIVDIVGIEKVPFLVPFILILFYFVVKAVGWIIHKTDKTPKSEELVLTALVLIYGIFVVWTIAVDFLNFTLITNFHIMIIPLTIIALGYSLWAQKKLKIEAKISTNYHVKKSNLII